MEKKIFLILIFLFISLISKAEHNKDILEENEIELDCIYDEYTLNSYHWINYKQELKHYNTIKKKYDDTNNQRVKDGIIKLGYFSNKKESLLYLSLNNFRIGFAPSSSKELLFFKEEKDSKDRLIKKYYHRAFLSLIDGKLELETTSFLLGINNQDYKFSEDEIEALKPFINDNKMFYNKNDVLLCDYHHKIHTRLF